MIGIDTFAVTKRKFDSSVGQIWGWWGFFLFTKYLATKDPVEKALGHLNYTRRNGLGLDFLFARKMPLIS